MVLLLLAKVGHIVIDLLNDLTVEFLLLLDVFVDVFQCIGLLFGSHTSDRKVDSIDQVRQRVCSLEFV